MIPDRSLVVLDTDLGQGRLSCGDVGKGARVYEVEFVDGGGSTVAFITV